MTTTNPSPQKISSQSSSCVIAGPWSAPTLETNIEELMQKAVEHKGQIKAHEVELKAILSKISDALEDGRLDDYLVDDKGKSFEFLGWRFNRKNRTSIAWNDEALEMMEEPKKALAKAEHKAKRLKLFTEKLTEYWELKQLKK